MSAKWLLVSGAGRSGTTFLNVLLNSHPEVALFTEAGIDVLIANVRRCLAWGNIYADSRGFPQRNTPNNEREKALSEKLFELRFNKNRLKIIGDKMPNVDDEIVGKYTEAVGRLLKIYIIRRPRDVISSSMARRANSLLGADEWHIASVDEAIVEWALGWEHVARSYRDGDTLAVSYERFEVDPEAEIARVADFLNLDKSGFATESFTRTAVSAEFDRADAQLVEKVLGPVETLMAQNLDNALKSIPHIYPKVDIDETIQTNSKWPCAALFFKKGFSQLEDWGVWTDAHDASLGFRLDPHLKSALISLYFTPFISKNLYFELHVRSDDRKHFEVFRFDTSMNRITLDLPCRPNEDGIVQIELHMPLVKTDADDPTYDPRALGIGLFSIRASCARYCDPGRGVWTGP